MWSVYWKLELEQALKDFLDLEIYRAFIKLFDQKERKTKKRQKGKRKRERGNSHRYRYKSIDCNSGVLFVDEEEK